jgi:hypothetical protein
MKKLTALIMALAMVMSLAAVAWATDGDEEEEVADATTEDGADNSDTGVVGVGTYEGSVDQEVFRVTLPTTTPSDLQFILDPQKLITETEGSRLGDEASFEPDATLFFRNAAYDAEEADDGEYEYSSDTAHFTVINKGATDVDVELTVTAKGTAVEGESPIIGFTDDNTFADNNDQVLYVALNTQGTDDESPTAVPISLDGSAYTATATATIAKTDGVYKYNYDETNGYSYDLLSDEEIDELDEDEFEGFKELEFWLSGAANDSATGNWGLGEDATLSLNLTWKITKFEAGPKINFTPVTGLSKGMEIALNVTRMTGYELKSVTYGDNDTQVSPTVTPVEGVAGAATITFTVDKSMNSAAPTAVKVIFTQTAQGETPAVDLDPKTVIIVATE